MSDDAFRALLRADAACAIAEDVASQHNAVVADCQYLLTRYDALERQVKDLTALVLALLDAT